MNVIQKIEALRQRTQERGCSPDEEREAQQLIGRLLMRHPELRVTDVPAKPFSTDWLHDVFDMRTERQKREDREREERELREAEERERREAEDQVYEERRRKQSERMKEWWRKKREAEAQADR